MGQKINLPMAPQLNNTPLHHFILPSAIHLLITSFIPPIHSSTNRTHRHIEAERCQNKPPQGVYVIQAYETHSTDPISFNLIQGQQGNSQGPWESPGNGMEEEGFLLYSLTAPFRHSGQKPSDCQYDPPHAASHGKEVQDHEEQGAHLREMRI